MSVKKALTTAGTIGSRSLNWQEMFTSWDRERNGDIAPTDFLRCLRRTAKLSPKQFRDEDMYELFAAINLNANGRVDFTAFHTWISFDADASRVWELACKLKAAPGGDNLGALFATFDNLNSGALRYDEFLSAVRFGAQIQITQASNEDVKRLFDAVDKQAADAATTDRSVSAAEFDAWFQKKSSEKGQEADAPTPVSPRSVLCSSFVQQCG